MTTLQRYNALDCIATFRLWKELEPKLMSEPDSLATYQEKKALSSPLMYAMLRGLLCDREEMEKLRLKFEAENKQLEDTLDLITKGLGLGVINLGSPTQKAWLLECLGAQLPKVRGSDNLSTDREAIEGVIKHDPELAPICNIILAWMNRQKMLTVLNPELVDADGRMRTFYKVSGTKTDRLSSAKNALWTGMNMQNIKRDEDEAEVGHASIRSMFIADPGKIFINVDLERADSWAVALEVFKYTGDRKYLDGCMARDLHTYVSRLVWPNLDWTDDEDHNVKVAKGFFYRQYDYRFMSKKLQHGSNYLGSWWELARQMKIPQHEARRGQEAYFRAFPAIKKWHGIRAMHLQTEGHVINLFGRRRNCHMRLDSKDTLKKIIAHLGQSVTAGSINRSIIRLWACQLQMPDLEMEFLAQVHDSALEQCPEENLYEVLDLMREVMLVPITVTSPQGETITCCIPLEFSVGWNWAAESPANPDGQRKIRPGERHDRVRQRCPATAPSRLMDRRLSSLHRGRLVA